MSSDAKIRTADHLFYEIFHDFNTLHFLDPINHEVERETFLNKWEAKESYNPVYEYNPLPPTLPQMKQRLEELILGTSALESCFEAIRLDLVARLELIEQRGTDKITALSTRLYGTPSPELVTEARQILKRRPFEPGRPTSNVGVKRLMERFRERFREDRIDGWDVVEDPHIGALAQTDYTHHKIRVQSGMIVSEGMMERLSEHHVAVHVYRAINGERQPYKAFALGFDGYLPTEEGLAVELEARTGLLTGEVTRRYAGRVLAANLAPHTSFFDMFKALMEFFPFDDAFTLTQRSKRGLLTTSEPGGLIQDHVYLQGQKDVSALSPSQLRLLYTGRIGVHHLPLVEELTAQKKLVAPAFIPSVFHG